MSTFRSFSWSFWAVLILSFIMIGACGKNTPTTPDPTDVLDIVEPGEPEAKDLTGLLSTYNALVEAGGGAASNDASNYAMIGVFDRWSKHPIAGIVTVTSTAGKALDGSYINGSVQTKYIDGPTLFDNLTYPITVTYYTDYYFVGKTIVHTNANVIALATERLFPGSQGTITGMWIELNEGSTSLVPPPPGSSSSSPSTLPQSQPYYWALYSKTTHIYDSWGFNDGENNPVIARLAGWPVFTLTADSYQPFGFVSILYGGDLPKPVYSDGSGSLVPADPWLHGIKYWYENVGSMNWGATSSYTTNYDYTKPANVAQYDEGAFHLDAFSMNGNGAITTIANFSPGGSIGATWEFIPYGLDCEVTTSEVDGTYDLETFQPPFEPDRYAIAAQVKYAQESGELVFAEWNPQDSQLPEIWFSTPPSITQAKFSYTDYKTRVNWSNNDNGELIQIKLYYFNYKLWDIYLDGSNTSFLSDSLGFPLVSGMTPADNMYVSVHRVKCKGIDVSDFDNTTIWNYSRSFADSTRVPVQIDFGTTPVGD